MFTKNKVIFDPIVCAGCRRSFVPTKKTQRLCGNNRQRIVGCSYPHQRQVSQIEKKSIYIKNTTGKPSPILLCSCSRTYIQTRKNQKCCLTCIYNQLKS